MKALRSLVVAGFCLAALSLSVFAADEARGSSGTTEGTFAGIERGDYTHFLIKDKHGKPASFIVLRDSKSIDSYLNNARQLRGRAVRVYWQEEIIPEAGQKMKTVTKVEARNPLQH